jgi:hypothetical protein
LANLWASLALGAVLVFLVWAIVCDVKIKYYKNQNIN